MVTYGKKIEQYEYLLHHLLLLLISSRYLTDFYWFSLWKEYLECENWITID
uniref:Uncharacterized protein n=1 Tax=Daphnia magna TaxID=35525 RepID=A0A0P5BJI7_9CRUS